jgi:hypothetical protein
VLADQSRRSSGCGGSGPRRGLGSRVHGGPKVLNEGVCENMKDMIKTSYRDFSVRKLSLQD